MNHLKASIFILSLVTTILHFAPTINAGGGYVGNGPMPTAIALVHPSFRHWAGPSESSASTPEHRNFFLLKKKEIEIQAGFFLYQSYDPILRITREGLVPGQGGHNRSDKLKWAWNPSLDFSYGLTSHLTWHGLTNLRFGLINNGGKGYEMAASVGLTTNGINGQHAAPYISYFTPGLSILQTWGNERFRLINTVFGSTIMDEELGFEFNELGASLHVFYKLHPRLSLGSGIGTAFYRTVTEGLFGEKPELLGPTASATFQVTKKLSLTLNSRFEPMETALPQPGLIMNFRW